MAFCIIYIDHPLFPLLRWSIMKILCINHQILLIKYSYVLIIVTTRSHHSFQNQNIILMPCCWRNSKSTEWKRHFTPYFFFRSFFTRERRFQFWLGNVWLAGISENKYTSLFYKGPSINDVTHFWSFWTPPSPLSLILLKRLME